MAFGDAAAFHEFEIDAVAEVGVVGDVLGSGDGFIEEDGQGAVWGDVSEVGFLAFGEGLFYVVTALFGKPFDGGLSAGDVPATVGVYSEGNIVGSGGGLGVEEDFLVVDLTFWGSEFDFELFGIDEIDEVGDTFLDYFFGFDANGDAGGNGWEGEAEELVEGEVGLFGFKIPKGNV